MKLNKLIAILPIIGILLTGCVDLEKEYTYSDTIENGGAYYGKIKIEQDENSEQIIENENNKAGEIDNRADNVDSVSKVDIDPVSKIKTIISIYEFEGETVNLQEDLEIIENKLHSLGGYINSHSLKEDDDNSNYAMSNISLNIPKDNASKLIDSIKNTLYIKSENSNSVDASEEIANIKVNIASLSEQEKRLINLQMNTGNVEEKLKIEDRLSNVINEKNKLISELESIRGKENHSNINLKIYEVKKITHNSKGNLFSTPIKILLVTIGSFFIYFYIMKPIENKNKINQKKGEK